MLTASKLRVLLPAFDSLSLSFRSHFCCFSSLNIMPLKSLCLLETRPHCHSYTLRAPISGPVDFPSPPPGSCPALRPLLQCHPGEGTRPERPGPSRSSLSRELPPRSACLSFPGYHTLACWAPALPIPCDGNLGCWLTAAPQRPVWSLSHGGPR